MSALWNLSRRDPSLGRHLFLAQRAAHDELDRRLREHGASVWTWVLLREADNADGASQRELADLMRIEPPTLVRHLDKLPGGARRAAARPRRPAGHAGRGHRRRAPPLAKIHDVVQELDAELRGVLTTREVDVLGRALPRIPVLHRATHFSQGRR